MSQRDTLALMSEENATQTTWDSVTDTSSAVVTQSPPTEVPSDTQPPLIESVASDPQNPVPAETSPLETTEPAQVEPEAEAVRESESLTPTPEEKSKDDYVAEADDPPEIAALSTPAAKRWAQRQFKDAAPTRKFVSYDVPISEFGDDLASRSPSRYTEHVKDVVQHHHDYASQMLFGMPFEDVKARLSNGQPSTTTETVSTTIPTAEELNLLSNEDIVERMRQLATAQPNEETEKLRSQVGELKSKLEGLTGKITTQEQTERQTQVMQIQNDVYNDVWKVVDECKRDWGLEVKADDPPRIANLKRAAARILDSDTEPTFDQDESNLKVVEYVVNAAKRLEKDNARREIDNLKVRARAAATKVKDSPEVKEILDEITAYANKSKATTRATSPAPPAPGSATGVTIKPPTTWDEAIEQSRVAA